jgi:phosphatidylglycerophosphatase A
MAADSTTSPRPDARFLLAHPAHFIALGFGAGLAPRAPGTFGTLAALALYWLLALVLPPLVIAFLAVPLFFLGVWACGVAGRHLGVEDHGAFDAMYLIVRPCVASDRSWR